MGEHLRADPIELRVGGAHLDSHAAELISRHTEAHGRMAAAGSGFIGASTAALSALTAHWESESAGHFTEILDHAEKFRTAADRYESTDSTASARLDAAARDLGDRMGL